MLKYKIVATVSFELETETHQGVGKAAKIHLKNVLNANNIQIQHAKLLTTNKIVLGEFALEEIFSKLGQSKANFTVGDKVYDVKMNSHRYALFAKNHICVACGIEGSKFLLEKHPKDVMPHFNMYAVKDHELILMTKDHIHAKSKGGQDCAENYQTMCTICNSLKDSYNIPVERIQELREIHEENKYKSRVELNSILHNARKRLSVKVEDE